MKVAIFGAGTMGSGIAQVFAAKGHTALMYASSVASAQKHKDKLAASLQKRVEKGKMTQETVDAPVSYTHLCMGTVARSEIIIVRTSSLGSSSPIWRLPISRRPSMIRKYRMRVRVKAVIIKKFPQLG